MILYKEACLEEELKRAPLLLRIMVSDFEKRTELFKKPIVITRILGKIAGDSGVHDDYRAVDIRDEHQGKFSFDQMERENLLNYMNNLYYRNDGKSSVIWHSFKGLPYHFHLQVASLTKTYMP